MAEISLIYRENVGGGNDDGVWRWRKTESHYRSSWLRRLSEIRHQEWPTVNLLLLGVFKSAAQRVEIPHGGLNYKVPHGGVIQGTEILKALSGPHIKPLRYLFLYFFIGGLTEPNLKIFRMPRLGCLYRIFGALHRCTTV